MFSKALMYIWDKKLEIAEISREIELKKLAHEKAHNFAMCKTDNKKLIAGNCKEYELEYKKQYDEECRVLGV